MKKADGRLKDTKEHLIIQGIKILNEEGFDKLTLKKAAQNCGISIGAPYRHFRDKEEFMIAINIHILSQIMDLFQDINSDTVETGFKKMMEGITNYFNLIYEHPEYIKIIVLYENNIIGTDNKPYNNIDKKIYDDFKNLFYKSNSNIEDYDITFMNIKAMILGLSIFISNETNLKSFSREEIINMALESMKYQLKFCIYKKYSVNFKKDLSFRKVNNF